MSLATIWSTDPEQLRGRNIQQIIGFAGRLLDGSQASQEFRQLLELVNLETLQSYADGCLQESFTDNGLALQDIVNEIGRRLDFEVEKGRYRGSKGRVGFDGVWRSEDGRGLIVEVKTADNYRIELARLAAYRRELVAAGKLDEASSSILIVVGHAHTDDLEAQVRGSRHAWDVRLISVRALLKLLAIKIRLDDPLVAQQVRSILAPHEYTRVDDIVDLVFLAAEDVERKSDEPEVGEGEGEETTIPPEEVRKPADFNDECVERIEKRLGRPLVKQSRVTWKSPDNALGVLCKTSRKYPQRNRIGYWFAVHSTRYGKLLSSVGETYVAFGCGSPSVTFLVPYPTFLAWADGLNVTTMKNGENYWHVHIWDDKHGFTLRRKGGLKPIDLSPYLLERTGESV